MSLEVDKYIKGYDSYDPSDGDSVDVQEILAFKDLSYGLYLNGECQQVRKTF